MAPSESDPGPAATVAVANARTRVKPGERIQQRVAACRNNWYTELPVRI